jgi:HEAT repeat protein
LWLCGANRLLARANGLRREPLSDRAYSGHDVSGLLSFDIEDRFHRFPRNAFRYPRMLAQPLPLKLAAILAVAFTSAVILWNETGHVSAPAVRRPDPRLARISVARPDSPSPIVYPAEPKKQPAVPPRKILDDLFALHGSDPASQLFLQGELVEHGDAAVSAIGEAFAAANDPAVKHVLADTLARIGTRNAIELLIAQAADEPSPAARAELLKAFNSLSHPDGLRVLATGLTVFEDPVVRQSAAHALGERAQPETVTYLTELYRDTASPNKKTVLLALATIRNPAAVPGLGQAIRRATDPAVIEALATSLAKVGTPSAVQILLDSLDPAKASHPPEVRSRLIDSLAQVRNPSSIYFMDASIQGDKLSPDILAALKQARRIAGAE